jgi:hypothetical protein
MNKLYRLPLRTRTKNLSSGVRRRQNSSKILATVILAFCALAALVAIGFAGFLTYKHMKGKPKVVSTASPTPAPTPIAKAQNVLLPLSDPNKTPSQQTAPAHSAVSPQPSPPVLMSSPVATPAPTPATPVPTPAASAVQHPTKTESQSSGTEKPLSKAARKALEKKRLEAEHKRAQLEKTYQNHEISIDAYNKGKEEYKTEIQKYREALKAGT